MRQRLGLKPGDQVAIQVEGNDIRLRPVGFTVENLAGSVPPLQCPRDDEVISHIAKEERVARFRSKQQG